MTSSTVAIYFKSWSFALSVSLLLSAGGVQPHCFLGPQPAPGMSRDRATQPTTTARRIQMLLSIMSPLDTEFAPGEQAIRLQVLGAGLVDD
jgi:hypothetical protein